ncbi:unnamed protein product [Dovyalis caffra]|uniref:Uncharacterized protein n=1 Tax=Dovyalis caffra TaxID=77055 RepID=A0AAV1RB85_9ROSI|nr:unnamed protein product [Dovyalis caffra]
MENMMRRRKWKFTDKNEMREEEWKELLFCFLLWHEDEGGSEEESRLQRVEGRRLDDLMRRSFDIYNTLFSSGFVLKIDDGDEEEDESESF